MHEIHPNLLWLGHTFDVREPRPLFDAGITAVVDVAFEEPPPQLPRQLLYLRFPLNDGGGNDPSILRFAVQSLVDLLYTDTRTLVACSAGMSRSPTIAAYSLACHLDITPELALNVSLRSNHWRSRANFGQMWPTFSPAYGGQLFGF